MFEDNLKERYGLAIDRIAEIKENSEIEDAGLAAYFTYTAEFLLLVDKWNEKRKTGGYDKLPLEEFCIQNCAGVSCLQQNSVKLILRYC